MSTISVPQPVICKCGIDGFPCICTAAGCFCSGPRCQSKSLAQNANYKNAKERFGEDFANRAAARMNHDAIGELIIQYVGAGPSGPSTPPSPPPPTPPSSKGTRRNRCCMDTDEGKPESSSPQSFRHGRGSKGPDDNPVGSAPLAHLAQGAQVHLQRTS
ncbi:uncharacterized protein DFL_001698 [Arthrobotrys flagrans]|uniref:Uncharacterized protein n=1 Tax=Arthrobotrys flagrans TaxID=97331 RepID=A0A437A8C4_ARTFL|nr:hypothetical protein DFL_001698 [Arthrobotrys flagrans]